MPYTDFGARHYSPALRRWLTPDPLSEKYYTSSPYAYCAGDPINLVDPDGNKILIWSQDSESSIEFHPEKKYEGSDRFVRIVYNLLNNAYSNGADHVFNQLISAREDYHVIDAIGKTGDLQFVVNNSGIGGSMFAGALLSDSYDLTLGVESVSHELFHALQYKEGQGGASITNEVEAYVFGYIVGERYHNTLSTIFQNSNSNLGNNSVIGSAYQLYFNAMARGVSNVPIFFEMAVDSFKKGAHVNMSGLYGKFPLRLPNYNNNLLSKYHPK